MNIVGGDVTGGITRTHFHQPAIELGDFLDIVMLELDKETLRPEDVVVPVHAPHGFGGVVIQQRAWDLG